MKIFYGALLVALLTACSTASSAPTNSPPADDGKVVFSQDSYSCSRITADPVWQFTAHLKDRAGGLKVQLVIAKLDAAGGETTVDTTGLTMSSPDNTSFTDGPLDLAPFCADPFGPGTYKSRIVSGDGSKVLAEGQFVIAK